MKKRIIIINGPNLNLLGFREPDIYGSCSWEDFFQQLRDAFKDSAEFIHFQSNSEGEIIDRIHQARGSDTPVHGIIINPGAYSHYSLAIADALAAVKIPAIEVHISNIMARESQRKTCVTAASCIGMICGLGLDGYRFAAEAILSMNQEKSENGY